ncbi:MAG: ATP phosphoribosyltransferase regulatory subunit [Xanthobacteraceae bacterium]|nr:ATP phosphoribosyltransferase regulatory subunit [Xanthobacteraceae bacterium]MBX3524402.1 ATP phosphoribosyltransferase regulatory subunit [Xanthobacteraceae bacterium]MBX3548652.1 ATP phosphoribosyltransferase regulatory subunit [Xanthobacteraceae bacterium]MCW5673797.1 ATP phosphoribosyltransferase regulatory subunit [Xanthobacteraceae bacterium]
MKTGNQNGKNGFSAALVDLYERAGYARVEPAILQPAEIFLELSGEELRRRLFIFTDSTGDELCLRPDLTIPVCRAHIEKKGQAANYCYLGPIFRDRGGGSGEYLQAGIEQLGREDKSAADAECLMLALDSAKVFGIDAPAIRMGDVGLFSALVAALKLPPAWQRRLLKDFNRTGTLEADLASLRSKSDPRASHAGVLAALEGADPKAARAFVTDLLSIAGISAVGGRTVEEIAERFLEQSSRGATSDLAPEAASVLEKYLRIAGDPDEALTALRALAAEAKLDLSEALEAFEQRTGFIAAAGIDVSKIKFATAFGRALDYYSGMVFELYDPFERVNWPLAAGGRYDNLLTLLGNPSPVPAVGFAAWVEELEKAGGAA